ncbi:MAG TPA: bifunctional tRNA (5-methylaminomethyl-2-thiouridine)(34)-methyltransferase MnmD/FAD-dependent 5-carboxymethylaminomethyl-2-thiouridine(34) oxidoreductase MnmC [Micavibrio sp.]|nr:bifunctional tRNA (5-methylaminomethyl-2-thiouridine)(34)-methyltransferase MnmD/FAD-dependent 5-carboxymethylaminomethyl-2-thiouridine(34) oxidoreductase MnmC [Micavibrio sp.]
MREPLYNQRFDDIYFSPEDGLAETRHVFLDGNDLPQAWRGKDHFTIVETGFGTGLNFLAAVKAFEATATDGQTLDFISFEKYPLDKDTIREGLQSWHDDIGEPLERMLAQYPLRVAGFHRIIYSAQIRLTLIFDDVNEAMPRLSIPRGVDAWFLDGFAPSKNPDMWSEALFSGIDRLSGPHSSIATFTAAGFVKRAIADIGFEVTKVRGFGRKREMITARREQAFDAVKVSQVKSVAIIGGGLAGTSCAYALKQYGIEPVIFEAGATLASGASGNMAGLYNPRFTAQRQSESDYYASAFAMAYRQMTLLQASQDIGFAPIGAMHLVNSPEKEKRYSALWENWGWHEDHLRIVNVDEASDIAGVPLEYSALFLPDSGAVSPAKLCEAYAQNIEVVLNASVIPERHGDGWRVHGRDFDAAVLTCGAGVVNMDGLEWLPVHTVRGQITKCTLTGAGFNTALCYGGYAAPLGDGEMICGSTFQKWRDDTDIAPEDDQDNIEKICAVVPSFKDSLEVVDHRAGLRVATQDHWPLIGSVPDYASWQSGDDKDHEGLYISAGHGSHGILSSLMGGFVIADILSGAPLSIGKDSAASVNPARFLERLRKKNQL